MAAQKPTDIRRHLQEGQADRAAVRRRQKEFETVLLNGPATTWLEAAVKARYLIEILAASSEGLDPRRRTLIASVLEDLQRPHPTTRKKGMLAATCLSWGGGGIMPAHATTRRNSP